MKTTMQIQRDALTGDLLFSGRVTSLDAGRLRLDAFDQAVIDDCSGSGRGAADWLLALEVIFRRLHEQQAPRAHARISEG